VPHAGRSQGRGPKACWQHCNGTPGGEGTGTGARGGWAGQAMAGTRSHQGQLAETQSGGSRSERVPAARQPRPSAVGSQAVCEQAGGSSQEDSQAGFRHTVPLSGTNDEDRHPPERRRGGTRKATTNSVGRRAQGGKRGTGGMTHSRGVIALLVGFGSRARTWGRGGAEARQKKIAPERSTTIQEEARTGCEIGPAG